MNLETISFVTFDVVTPALEIQRLTHFPEGMDQCGFLVKSVGYVRLL